MTSDHPTSPMTDQQARAALAVSELSYRRLFEAAQDGILILDAEFGRITDANPFLAKLLGFSHSEMLGKTVGELSPFKDVVSNQAMLERLQKDGYIRYEDLPLKTKDGRAIAVEFVCNVYPAGDKNVIQCNIRDITLRKHAESTTNLLAAIVESAEDAILAVDLNNHITSWNQGAERLYGHAASKVMGRSLSLIIPASLQAAEARIIGRIRSGEKIAPMDTVRLTKDGRLVEVSVTASAIKDAAGRVVGVSKAARDISERRRSEADREVAENSLRASEEKFRQIAETIHEVFWITDATMNQIIYISPAYEKIWGRTCESLYESPRSWLESVYHEDRQRVIDATTGERVKAGFDQVYRMTRPDGSLRWIEARAVPVRNAAGDLHRLVGTADDITEKRELEESFRQAQKIESIGQLAGGIAHDFNNILAAIVNGLYLAKLDAAGQPAILESLEEISKASQRAIDLVRQILTFSRLNQPGREPLRLNSVVLEALKLLRSSVPATIRIQTELAETPPVRANATAIHQLIMNLGTNAWHAMRDQIGVLKIEMNVGDVNEEFARAHPPLHMGRHVKLSVCDTGCGMDAATLGHIFEPFFTTKAVGQGTGLGLAVVHGIMAGHEGCAAVSSEPGQGTRFDLYFPIAETDVIVGPALATPMPRGNGEHVLLVDDEPVLANAGKKILELLGYRVTAFTSPLAALTAMRDRPGQFDLILTDLTMPEMDGARLGSRLLLLQPGLPIIIMTGYGGAMTPAKVEEYGFQEMLNKPCSTRVLAEAIHRALGAAARGHRTAPVLD